MPRIIELRRTTLSLLFGLWVSPALAVCNPIEPPASGGFQFFLGLQPTDGVLDAWCRLQTLKGQFKVNVLFPVTKAHRSFDADFDGTRSLDKKVLSDFIQSLIPVADGPSKDENGMPFPQVLRNTVQAVAAKTPDGDPLGLPRAFPASKELLLWEPLVLRMKPVRISGSDFTVEIHFKPSIARFLLDLQGQAETFQIVGYKTRILNNNSDGSCTPNVPQCQELPTAAPVRTAWQFDKVVLTATGGGLSAATLPLFTSIAEDPRGKVKTNTLPAFKASDGTANVVTGDDYRMVEAVAVGDTGKSGGTRTITVTWKENPNNTRTYSAQMDDYAQRARDALVLAYGNRKPN